MTEFSENVLRLEIPDPLGRSLKTILMIQAVEIGEGKGFSIGMSAVVSPKGLSINPPLPKNVIPPQACRGLLMAIDSSVKKWGEWSYMTGSDAQSIIHFAKRFGVLL